MYLKYLFVVENEPIAFKWNEYTGKAEIGGFRRNAVVMESMLKEYFHSEQYTLGEPQKNKVKYGFTLERQELMDVLLKLKEDGIVVSSVKTHERLMR